MSGNATAAATGPVGARLAPWRARWHALGLRERRLVLLAGAVLGTYLVWLLTWQPAWHTARTAPAQIAALDAQLQQMQALAAEAAELRAAPVLGPEQAAQALRAAADRLGAQGRLQLQGERAVLTLNGASPAQLRDWLVQARAGARARPVQAQLTRNAQGYSGTIVLALGAAP